MSEKLLVVTGGGDCPGLNAAIRAVTLAAHQHKWEVFGSTNAFNGLLNDPIDLIELLPENVRDIHNQGGTILGTSNKGVPSQFPMIQSDGSIELKDRTNDLIQRFHDHQFTALINIGGDGSQRISYELQQKGLNVIGIPKTIDNDLAFTDFTFGFRTAVEIATDALDKLTTTAKSHHRVMILEVMGRDAGWIALNAGIAGGADAILIPENPYSIENLVDHLNKKFSKLNDYAIIVIAEGAFPKDGEVIGFTDSNKAYQNLRLGGIGQHLAASIEDQIEKEIRVSVLGHLQRGGSPVSIDRIIASEFGVKAVQFIKEKRFGVITSYDYPNINPVPLEYAIRENKLVNMNSDLVQAAKGLNIFIG
jgi:phosphofructokinase-like protein